MSIKEILRMPYILFVVGMLDAPSIDYDKKKKMKTAPPKTAEEEANLLNAALR
jgi:hypothetical protein